MHDLDPLIFQKGQGRRQTAFLCYSSGTSGQPVSCVLDFRASTIAKSNLESSDDLSLQRDRKYLTAHNL